MWGVIQNFIGNLIITIFFFVFIYLIYSSFVALKVINRLKKVKGFRDFNNKDVNKYMYEIIISGIRSLKPYIIPLLVFSSVLAFFQFYINSIYIVIDLIIIQCIYLLPVFIFISGILNFLAVMRLIANLKQGDIILDELKKNQYRLFLLPINMSSSSSSHNEDTSKNVGGGGSSGGGGSGRRF